MLIVCWAEPYVRHYIHALITSNSVYRSNRSPHMLHNLSREAAAVRVGGIWNGHLVIMTETWVSTASFLLGLLSLCPLDPTLQIRHPWLTPGTYAAAVHALNPTAILRLCIRPPKWGGFFWLSRWPQAWSGGPARHLPGFTEGQLSSHVGLCNECTLDSQWEGCKVGDYGKWWVFLW